MANAREVTPMSSRFQCRLLLLAASGLQLVACSSRTDVAPVGGSDGVAQVHARAAQRVDLPGATVSALPAASAALTSGTRAQPAAPEMLRLPDGTVGIKVAQQYYHTIVACRLPDGSFTTQCPPGQERQP
jgi:hypothetical protein